MLVSLVYMERVPKSADSHTVESGQEGNPSIGEVRLQRLMNLLKKGIKRPLVEIAELDQTVGNLRNRISTSFEQSRSESFEDRKKRREEQKGWQTKFYGKPLVKAFDMTADVMNYFEKKKAERVIEEEDRMARLKLDAIKAARLQEVRERLIMGTRTRV